MTTQAMPQAKLLKSRIYTTRIFAAVVIFALLFTAPLTDLRLVAQWIGYLALVAATIGRMICTIYVGGRKNAELVAIGPYSVVRNPLYVFSFLGVLGIGLISGMVSIAVLLVLAFVIYYSQVVDREEKFLEERFGQIFRDYKSRTPAWIPDFKLWQSPESLSVNPKFVLITLRDGVWFLLAWPILALIAYAQDAGFLPVLLRLY